MAVTSATGEQRETNDDCERDLGYARHRSWGKKQISIGTLCRAVPLRIHRLEQIRRKGKVQYYLTEDKMERASLRTRKAAKRPRKGFYTRQPTAYALYLKHVCAERKLARETELCNTSPIRRRGAKPVRSSAYRKRLAVAGTLSVWQRDLVDIRAKWHASKALQAVAHRDGG